MIVNGLRFNCLTRWMIMKPMDHLNESWEDIENAMIGNTSVTDVYLGPYFYSCLSSSELSTFLQKCATHFCNLRVVSIGTLEYTQTYIHATSALCTSTFLIKAQNLHTLRIERDLMLQSPMDVQTLANCFSNHPSLKRVSLPHLHPVWLMDHQVDLVVTDNNNNNSHNNNNNKDHTNHQGDTSSSSCMTLDPLLRSLAGIDQLESLQLGLSDSSYTTIQSLDRMDHVCTPSAVATLGTLPHLSWLVILRFHMQDKHIHALCQSIKKNNAPIKILDFTKTRHVTARAWKAVLDLLQTHVHLEALDMFCPNSITAQKIQQEQQRLRQLSLHPNGGDRGHDDNDNEDEDEPLHDAKWYKQHVLSFLKMNREGRRRKLRQLPANRNEWINCVSRYFINDMTALTVLVRECPWICFRQVINNNNSSKREVVVVVQPCLPDGERVTTTTSQEEDYHK